MACSNWVVTAFQDFSQEAGFLRRLLEVRCAHSVVVSPEQADPYNNSAWSHKMFTFKRLGCDKDPDAVRSAVLYLALSAPPLIRRREALSYLKFGADNESLWSFLRGCAVLLHSQID